MRLFLTLALLTQIWVGSAQVYFNKQIDWQHNQEYLGGVVLLPDSTIFLAGGEGNYNPFHQASFLVNLTQGGSLVWSGSFLPRANASGNTACAIPALGGIIIEGNYFVSGDSAYDLQIFLTKLDGATGDTLWTKEYGQANVSDNGLRMVSTVDSGFAVCGWAFLENNTQHSRLLLLKTDSLGNQIFRKEYTTDIHKDHYAYSLLQTNDGGFLIFGLRAYEGTYLGGVGTANKNDMVLIRTDAQGNQQWVKVYPPWDWKQILFYGLDLQPLPNGDFLMAGVKSYALFQPGNTYVGKYFFAKINSSGEFVDSVTLPKDYYFFRINRLKPSSDGNFWAIGAERDTSTEGQTGLIMKISPNLEVLWKREYRVSPPESTEHEIFYEGVEMPDHGFVLCGGAYGPLEDSTYQNAWVIRVDSLGCLEPGCQLNSAVEDPPAPEQDIGITLSPNPTIGQARLTLAHEGAVLLGMRVLDVQGRVVSDMQFLRSAGWRECAVDLGGESSGVYVVQVRTSEGWGVRKIVKEQ